jgi:catechol 2,3-dioxygenase-like lactoylglutathione lyase family enzyme
MSTVVNHVGLATGDLDRAIAFYTAVLGFAEERRLVLPDDATAEFLAIERPVNLEAVYLRRDEFVLELLAFHRQGNPAPRERVFNEPGLTHISFSVDDLDASVAAVEANGGEIVRRYPYAVIARDPDGQLIELLPMSYRTRLDAERERSR